jgi:DnaJ-class molecular chaperone
MSQCKDCKGNGTTPDGKTCDTCNGNGMVIKPGK